MNKCTVSERKKKKKKKWNCFFPGRNVMTFPFLYMWCGAETISGKWRYLWSQPEFLTCNERWMLFAALMVGCRLLTQYLTSMAESLRLGLTWEMDKCVHPVLVALLVRIAALWARHHPQHGIQRLLLRFNPSQSPSTTEPPVGVGNEWKE